MKRFFAIAFAMAATAALFAQAPQTREDRILKSLNLTDAQISQVKDALKAVQITVHDDQLHIRTLRSQIQEQVLASNAKPDMQALGKLIDQETQLRADMEKAFVAAELKVKQIMGADAFERFVPYLGGNGRMGMGMRGRFAPGQGRGPWGGMMQNRPGPGGAPAAPSAPAPATPPTPGSSGSGS